MTQATKRWIIVVVVVIVLIILGSLLARDAGTPTDDVMSDDDVMDATSTDDVTSDDAGDTATPDTNGTDEGTSQPTVDAVVYPTVLTSSRWQWQETEYTEGSTVVAAQPDQFEITFGTDGTFYSRTDCNNVVGEYGTQGSTLTLSSMAMTKMACLTPGQESEYVAMLGSVAGYAVVGNDLTLTFAQDAGDMHFVRVQ